MKSIKFEKIKKQYDGWVSYYAENKARGEKAVDFFIAGNQWEEYVVTNRAEKNKESLTFNLGKKHLRRAHTQMGEIEFDLDLVALNQTYNDNVTETAAFRLILNSILLNDETLDKFRHCGIKCLNYGMAFAEVNFGYESQDTLNLEPKLIIHKDPSIAFWDKNALHPTKTDGRFAGFCRTLTAKELIEKYPSLKKATWLKEKDNKVFDYWYREYTAANFIMLKSGIQKREDLLTTDDKNNIAFGAKSTPGKICEIYYQRSCEEKELEPSRKFPTIDLPIVYHSGLTEWHPQYGDITIPYCEDMRGAQSLHNYLLSQVASQAKDITGDKYFFSNDHVTTQTQRNNAKDINKRDGGFTFSGDIGTIRREQPGQLSETLIEMANVSKQEIDEINGAMIDTQNAQQTVIAGVALDKVTQNMEALNMYFMEGHILFVNQIGKLYRQMIPHLYTQERSIIVNKKEGGGESIVINQDAGTGTLINNIKDINNNFKYEITAGPSSAMQKENTIKYLLQVYEFNPQMFQATAHIFFRNLETEASGELARIAMAMGDMNLIKYSQGEITLEEYQQAKQKQMQQQLQQQQQLAQSDPQVLSAQALAAAQHRKASADEFDAQTKRMEAINKADETQSQFKLKLYEIMTDNGIKGRQQDVEELRTQMEQNQQIIDALRTEKENNGKSASK